MANTPNELFKSLILDGNDVYENFINAIRTQTTKQFYIFSLKKFMLYRSVKDVRELLPSLASSFVYDPGDIKNLQADVARWLNHLKNVEKLAPITIKSYLAAILKFYAMNDIVFNRKKLISYLPVDRKQNHDDRAYTREEIVQLLKFSDERTRALILLLASTGMRIGGIVESDKELKSYLKLSHLQKIPKYNLYQITVYKGFKEEYFCFTTPEAAAAIDTYLQYRQRYGEKLTPDSPLFREQFNTLDIFDCRHPKVMDYKGLVQMLVRVLNKSGVMQATKLVEGQKIGTKRNPIARAHGFRKYVITTMEAAGLTDMAMDRLLSQNTSSLRQRHYYRPQAESLLQEYLKVVDALTINEENRLKQKVEQLTVEKSEIEVLREEIEQLKAATKEHINAQVKESNGKSIEGVKISEELMEQLYKEAKTRLDNAMRKYIREHPEYFLQKA
jgi:integrase